VLLIAFSLIAVRMPLFGTCVLSGKGFENCALCEGFCEGVRFNGIMSLGAKPILSGKWKIF